MPGKALKIIKGYLLVHIVVLGKKKKDVGMRLGTMSLDCLGEI